MPLFIQRRVMLHLIRRIFLISWIKITVHHFLRLIVQESLNFLAVFLIVNRIEIMVYKVAQARGGRELEIAQKVALLSILARIQADFIVAALPAKPIVAIPEQPMPHMDINRGHTITSLVYWLRWYKELPPLIVTTGPPPAIPPAGSGSDKPSASSDSSPRTSGRRIPCSDSPPHARCRRRAVRYWRASRRRESCAASSRAP